MHRFRRDARPRVADHYLHGVGTGRLRGEDDLPVLRVLGGVGGEIADDLLDASASSAELGKTAGKDARQCKATFATVLGAQAARAEAARRVERAVDRLHRVKLDSSLLEDLAHFMISRRS